MQIQKHSSQSNNIIGIIFISPLLLMGATFAGIIVGAIVGWIAGVVVGENSYGTALVGAGGGAIIGIASVLVIGIGIAFSKDKDKIFGHDLSKIVRVSFPTIVALLFVTTVVTIPIHNILLEHYIIPILLPAPYIPDQQDLSPRVKYERLIREGDTTSLRRIVSPSSFSEGNIFKEICTGSRGKDIPLTLVNGTVFIVANISSESGECKWSDTSLISADVTTGKVNWQSDVGSDFIAADTEHVYAEFPPGERNIGITAYDLEDGDVVWHTPLSSWVAGGINYLAITGNNLSVNTSAQHGTTGAFHVLDPTTGEIEIFKKKPNSRGPDFTFMIEHNVIYKWFGHSMTASGVNEWETEFVVSDQDNRAAYHIAPVVTDGMILIRMEYPDYSPITAIDKQTGQVVWEIYETAVSNLAVDGPVTYFVTEDAELMAVETQTGKVVDSVKFEPSFGPDFYFPNNSIIIAAHKNIVAVYFEDKQQLSILHREQ